ncbi:UNVERIFIED_CONTAM: DNA glycosylase/AP lyase ROS1 [Sesamum radiatum]|uniref:DNA glycosylase/AP lyase ROS1 n=1 Tax=Sesamum radiatum TaxID=300843 RepID=A0AAW2R4Z9_SESRA
MQNLYNHQKSTNKSMGPPLALTWKCMPSVDSITEQLNQLDLNAESGPASAQMQNVFLAYHTNYDDQHALVPFQTYGAVVPFDSYQVRRRRPRPKVDLDDETTRVWKLLLENINSEGIDGTDEEKTKWWEEERRVFNGRADSFIARMHLVQGDRRFSPWKGSVVDSVVGVFLTQNVSDHLSSSAFMALAARFPLDQRANTWNYMKRHYDFEDDGIREVNSVKSSGNNFDAFIPKDNLRGQSTDTSKDDLNSADSPIAQTIERSDSCLPSTSEEEPTAADKRNPFTSSTSFVKLLQMAGSVLHGVYEKGAETPEFELSQKHSKGINSFSDKELFAAELSGLSSESASQTTDQKITAFSFEEGPKTFQSKCSLKTKAKGGRNRKEKENQVDWDQLRKQAQAGGRERVRTANTLDSVDWDAVRCADVNEIAHTIKERGMNNMLAERIKDFLNRIVRDHGSIDLEWLRDIPPDKAKEYLLSIRGLGLKSVECVRLLTLHHLAFPVDTNVGRIAVRLGWVPLQPLPESLQLHLLELYPVLESIQKYLWPRLCKLDQKTLYELHYQMITFGKVFCTKSKPNCNACPMRGECRHFASAFASARLALPAPEDKSIVSATGNRTADQNPVRSMNTLQLPSPQANQMDAKSRVSNSQPIIEEPATPEPIVEVPATPEPIIEVPATPEPNYTQAPECDIENAFDEDPDEIPTIKLNMEEFTHNLQKIMQQNTELLEGDMSKALVALTSQAASIPVPKLKNVSRLRTEHQVWTNENLMTLALTYLLYGPQVRESLGIAKYL